MSQQKVDPSRYTRTLVVKSALSQMYDQLLPTSKSLETACNYHCTHTSMPHHVSVPRSRNFSDSSPFWILLEKTTGPIIQPIQPFSQICGVTPQFFICTLTVRLCVCVYVCVCVCVCVCMRVSALFVAVTSKYSTVLTIISKCSTASIMFLLSPLICLSSSLLSVLALGPTVRVYSSRSRSQNR